MIDNVITGGRQSGRTTRLIELCAEAEAKGEVSYIVCQSHSECYRIAKLAETMELRIAFPISYDEFRSIGQGHFIKNFYIDNADTLLEWLAGPVSVKAITVQT